MRRTAITLLFLLSALATAWAAGSADWSKHIVPKPYDADAVLVTKSDTSYHGRVYQIYRDQLGSALLYANRTHSYGFHYSPWGTRLIDETTQTTYRPGQAPPQGCPFYRTYTGHEDLWMFGLLNMNTRLYNPYLGRFLSPDPLLNQEGGPLDYNPYVYARNNPYKYIDRDGEFAILPILLAGAFIGAALNTAANFNNINNAWDFCKFFVVGGIAGGVSTAAFFYPPVAIGGFAGGAITGAIGCGTSGFILNGGNALILGNNFWGSAFTGMWQGALSGAVMWGIARGVQAITNGRNFWNGNIRVQTNAAPNLSVTPQQTQYEFAPQEMPNPSTSSSTPETLIHYTSEEGYRQIIETETLNPSIGIKNARY